MNLYRVDKRKFKVGETILPERKFEEGFTGERLELEELFNKMRPSEVPERGKCLFLFQDLAGTLRHVAKYGGFIYSVHVTSDHVFFCGDINKLENIFYVFKITRDESIREAVVKDYWEYGHTYNPCYEILTKQATVDSIICGEDIQDRLKEELRFVSYCIERCPTYIGLIKMQYP